VVDCPVFSLEQKIRLYSGFRECRVLDWSQENIKREAFVMAPIHEIALGPAFSNMKSYIARERGVVYLGHGHAVARCNMRNSKKKK
jgi:hypothetical protein